MKGRVVVETSMAPGDMLLLDHLFKGDKGDPNLMFYLWVGESRSPITKTALMCHFLQHYPPDLLLRIKVFPGAYSEEPFFPPAELDIPANLDRTLERPDVTSMDYFSLLCRTRPAYLFLLKEPRELRRLKEMGFGDTLKNALQNTQIFSPPIPESPFRKWLEGVGKIKFIEPANLYVHIGSNPTLQLLSAQWNKEALQNLYAKLRNGKDPLLIQHIQLLSLQPTLVPAGVSSILCELEENPDLISILFPGL